MRKTKKAIVLHADILGFKELIYQSELDKEDETLITIINAIKEALRIVKDMSPAFSVNNINVNYKVFSDNLYVSFEYIENDEKTFSNAFVMAITFARLYYSIMLDNKLLIRGAISFGDDYSDDNIIFSIALVKAYTLECEKAIYPRIILDEELYKKISANLILDTQFAFEVLNSSLIKDSDGLIFLTPSGLSREAQYSEAGFSPEQLYKGFIKRDIDFILLMLKNNNINSSPKIKKKYEWLAAILFWLYYDRVPSVEYKFSTIFFNKIS